MNRFFGRLLGQSFAFTPTDAATRKGRITGTRVGMLLNMYTNSEVSYWGGPLKAWEAVLGIGEPVADNEAMRMGRDLEPFIIKQFESRTGLEVLEVNSMVHPKLPFIASTPDGLVVTPDGKRHAFEAKTASSMHAWGREFTNEIAYYYVPQVVLEIACMDVEGAYVSVLCNNRYYQFYLPRDGELEKLILGAAQDFYEKYVVTKTPPPECRYPDVENYIKRQFPVSEAITLQGDGEVDDIMVRYGIAQQAKLEAENNYKKVRVELMKKFGKADTIVGDGYRATYKTQRGREVLDKEAMAADGIDLEKYKKRNPSYRSLRITNTDGSVKHVGPENLKKELRERVSGDKPGEVSASSYPSGS